MADHDLPPWEWPRAAYIHVPFCAHHCGYCDFAVAVGQDDRMDEYLDALEIELSTLREPQPIDTLFLGGGTPTYLSHRPLERLLRLTQQWLPLSSGHEFSTEANPSFLDKTKIELLHSFGVNRLSLGVQSFHPALLKILERDHSPDDVTRVLEFIRPLISNFSVDLIFGVPGQSQDQWHSDLVQALALAPKHIATYGLTYEKGTRLWKQRERGEVCGLDEDTECDLYLHTMDVLEQADFEHYEISNFSRHGFACRHNHAYWANHAYFGFGVGAARYVRGARELNTRDVRTYIRRLKEGRLPTFQSERLPPWERAVETMAVQLRRGYGIDRNVFMNQTGFSLDDLVGPKLDALCQLELLINEGDRVCLTRKGKCLADGIVEALMGYVQIRTPGTVGRAFEEAGES